MLRFPLASARAAAGLAGWLALVALTAGCGTDADGPLGPERTLDPSAPVPVAEMDLAAQPVDLQFGDFALHVPANVHQVRGILIALGGPDTRGFAAGTPFGAPLPQVEASLQMLGAMFRDLAAERGLAILGSRRAGPAAYPDESASDQLLLDAIAQAAALTGRSDLLDAPFLLYGASGGGPEAVGFTRRHPERVAALFLKVPQSAGPLSGPALEVPAYMVLAEFDAFIDNAALTATFEAHRAAGAPWAMALERGVPHHALSPAQRQLTVDWMKAILPIRTAGGSVRPLPGQAGWLGDPVTGQIVPIVQFDGNPSTASWLPSRLLAEQWATFIGF